MDDKKDKKPEPIPIKDLISEDGRTNWQPPKPCSPTFVC